MAYVESGGMSRDVVPGEVESMVTHYWLKDDVKPLGLYTWELRLKNCVIL